MPAQGEPGACPDGLRWQRFKQRPPCCWLAVTTHQGIAIVHAEQVEYFCRSPSGPDRTAHESLLWDDATCNRLRQLRWRERSRDPRPAWLALGTVLLLHVLFVAVVWHQMRPPLRTSVPPSPESVLHVRLIEPASPAVVAPPMPPPVPPPLSRMKPTREPVSKQAMTIQLPASPSPVQLYDRDGQLRLPATAASAGATPGYVRRKPQGDTQIMHNTDPIKYRATSLDKYFPPPDETAGGALVRRAVDAVVKTRAIDLPGGVHLKCKTVLGIPIPNCIDPPAPPSAKVGDERLSMAPARPLAVDPHAPEPPSVEACIAMYRDGKPLAHGCPVDTPDRSVDAELRERAAKAASGR